jgi:hypothetical protein
VLLRVWKPVEIRRGRATVTSVSKALHAGSQTLPHNTLSTERVIPEEYMSDTTFAPVAAPAPIPVGEILPWAIFGGLLMLIVLYFVGTEEGAMALFNGMYVHEFVHDGRHLLGFPCH